MKVNRGMSLLISWFPVILQSGKWVFVTGEWQKAEQNGHLLVDYMSKNNSILGHPEQKAKIYDECMLHECYSLLLLSTGPMYLFCHLQAEFP